MAFPPKRGPIKDFRKARAVACRRAGVQGRVPDDLRRSAVRNLEYAGVPGSIAMAMVGHRSDSIYQSIASVDRAVLKESASKIAAFHESRISAQVQDDSAIGDAQNPRQRRDLGWARANCAATAPRESPMLSVPEFLLRLIHCSCF
jgi:hypothetical protein